MLHPRDGGSAVDVVTGVRGGTPAECRRIRRVGLRGPIRFVRLIGASRRLRYGIVQEFESGVEYFVEVVPPSHQEARSARSARRAARGPDACAEAAATRDTSSATTSAHLPRACLAHMPSKPRRRALAAKTYGGTRPIDTTFVSEVPTKRLGARIRDACFGVPRVPLIRASSNAAPPIRHFSQTARRYFGPLHTQTVCKNRSHLRRRSPIVDIFAGKGSQRPPAVHIVTRALPPPRPTFARFPAPRTRAPHLFRKRLTPNSNHPIETPNRCLLNRL